MTTGMEAKQKNRQFYKMVFVIVIPVIIQNLINTSVNSVDVFMLGYVSQTALSASSLANQLYNILSFVYMGVAAGASVLATQYWGKKDCRTIEKVLGISLQAALLFAVVFALAAAAAPRMVMSLYTNEQEIIEAGAVYLRIISVTYILSAITQMYLNIQRCVERVNTSTIVLSSSLFINVGLNACFIFGIGPFPKLGLVGVAIATCIARCYELVFCLIDSKKQAFVKFRGKEFISRHPGLFSDFVKYSFPVIANDVIASVGWSMYTVIMGHLGSDVVAANSIAVVARNYGTVVCFGFTSGCLIILGRTLGENRLELAKEYAKKFLGLAVLAGFIGIAVVMLARPVFLFMSNLTPQAEHYLKLMLYINAYYCMGMAMNSMWISAIFRAGGDTKFGFLTDTICLWAVVIPVGFILAFAVHLPPMWVYFFLLLDEFFKMPFCYRHYRKYKWLQNITRDYENGGVHENLGDKTRTDKSE